MGRTLPWKMEGSRERPVLLDVDNDESSHTVEPEGKSVKSNASRPTKRRKQATPPAASSGDTAQQEVLEVKQDLQQSACQKGFLDGLDLC